VRLIVGHIQQQYLGQAFSGASRLVTMLHRDPHFNGKAQMMDNDTLSPNSASISTMVLRAIGCSCFFL